MAELIARRVAIRERMHILRDMEQRAFGADIYRTIRQEADRLAREMRGCRIPSDWGK